MRLFYKHFRWFFVVLLMMNPAFAQQRIALVVGNGVYDSVVELDNPVNDALLISKTLEGLDFKVTLVTDATQFEFKRAVSQFGRDLRAGGRDTVGLFYYAGHGVQSFGANYLLPVDASLTDAADLDLVALEASAVLRQMASARNQTNIFILDACRNNPFEAVASMNDNGLAEMNAPTGTYLAYATAPGAVSLDGAGGNSPFTSALAVEMTREGLQIEQVFKKVRVSVIDETRGVQTPWDTSSLTTNFVFNPGAKQTPEQVAEEQLWNSVSASRDPVQIMLFIRSYPGGTYIEEARDMLSVVMREELSGDGEGEGTEIAALPNTAEPPPQFDTQSPAVEDPASRSILFSVPLSQVEGALVGRSIKELIAGSPLYPPVEGLPEEFWKAKKCTDCHAWDREILCTQAKTYLELSAQRALGKEHPYGGGFKRTLKTWAAGGCE